VDLASQAACQGLVAALMSSGGIDVLVNNAGLLIRQRISEVTAEDLDRTFAVNFRAPFILAQGLVERMREVGWGRIINVSSIGARTGGLGTNSVYAASKAALISLTKNLARAYGAHGITVNAIAPGGVDTPMSEESGPEVRARIASEIPIGRLGKPEEAAAAIGFLASEAASWINGVTLDVNGGWVMV
jgi:3-oxoacyl-[acyl-carrier protein] reductase